MPAFQSRFHNNHITTTSQSGVDLVLVILWLTQAGANIEHVGSQGATALMIAASFGHTSVARVLLDHGADPDHAHAFAGTTALHFASEVSMTSSRAHATVLILNTFVEHNLFIQCMDNR